MRREDRKKSQQIARNSKWHHFSKIDSFAWCLRLRLLLHRMLIPRAVDKAANITFICFFLRSFLFWFSEHFHGEKETNTSDVCRVRDGDGEKGRATQYVHRFCSNTLCRRRFWWIVLQFSRVANEQTSDDERKRKCHFLCNRICGDFFIFVLVLRDASNNE